MAMTKLLAAQMIVSVSIRCSSRRENCAPDNLSGPQNPAVALPGNEAVRTRRTEGHRPEQNGPRFCGPRNVVLVDEPRISRIVRSIKEPDDKNWLFLVKTEIVLDFSQFLQNGPCSLAIFAPFALTERVLEEEQIRQTRTSVYLTFEGVKRS